MNNSFPITPARRLAAWGVHFFTASAAIFGVFTLSAIYQQHYILGFWFMAAAILIDAVDGALARFINVKAAVPKIDGALLDNIVDYLNYVITPSFFLLVTDILPPIWNEIIVSLIVLASAYQFTQSDAKTPDHFFKGFPCYWNFAVFYLYISDALPFHGILILLFLILLIFIPIKYIYPSRMEYLSKARWIRHSMLGATIVYGIASALILAQYPHINVWFLGYSVAYIVLYLLFSLYRTFYPLPYPHQPEK